MQYYLCTKTKKKYMKDKLNQKDNKIHTGIYEKLSKVKKRRPQKTGTKKDKSEPKQMKSLPARIPQGPRSLTWASVWEAAVLMHGRRFLA